MIARVRAAWRILRHGVPAEPEPRGMVAVPIEELRGLIRDCMAACGLPRTWMEESTSAELRALAGAVEVERNLRADEWRDVEAGRWPVP